MLSTSFSPFRNFSGRIRRRKLLLTFSVMAALWQGASSGAAAAQALHSTAHSLRFPIQFEPNAGQTDPEVDFVCRGPGYSIFLSPKEAVLALRPRHSASGRELPPGKASDMVLRMRLVGANPHPEGQGIDILPGTANYFIGRNPDGWRTSVPTFAKVRYKRVYPGVDLIYYGTERQLEYDFIVDPFADPKRIEFSLTGAERVEIDADGNLVMASAQGEVRWRKPFAYQETATGRREVGARFVLTSGNHVSFELAPYDQSEPLIIDPVLYSTYLGGGGADFAIGMAVDPGGNVFLFGDTGSLNFPTTNAYRATPVGSNDLFVAKLNPAGTALLYSTYIGGSGDDYAGGITVDSGGNAFLTGHTDSQNYPTRNPAYSANAGFFDIFLTKLGPNGTNLVYSTYLGGDGDDFGRAVAIDSGGSAYVTGRTFSKGTGGGPFPTSGGAFQANNGSGSVVGADAFVTKFNTNGALSYSTFLGGHTDERGDGIAVDNSGNAYITGEVQSYPDPFVPPTSDFPVLNAFQPAFNQGSTDPFGGTKDAFLTKLNATGTALIFSTFLGGFDNDFATGIVLDSGGRICLVGITSSTNFPTVNAAQPINAGAVIDPDFPGPDAFVAQFNSNGTAILYSTYLGGTLDEFPFLLDRFAIAADRFNNLYVAGQSGSFDFPLTQGADQTNSNASVAAFVAKINPAVSGPASLIYSSLLAGDSGLLPGGADNEAAAIGVDTNGNFYVAGITSATNFPTKPGSLRTTNSGGFCDAFVVKYGSPPDLSVTMSASQNPVLIGSNVLYTIRINNNSFSTFTGVTNVVQFPTNVQFGAITSSLGAAPIIANGSVTFSLGTLTNNASVLQTIVITNITPGTSLNTASLSSVETPGLEPNKSNNVASVLAAVRGIADVTLAQSGAPNPTYVTSNLTYTIGITNKGPSPATQIVVTDSLPANLVFVTASSTAGTWSTNGSGTVTFNIPILANGVGASLTILAQAIASGSATNAPSVTAFDADFSPGNNSSTLVTAIVPLTDIGLGMTASANTVSAGQNVVFTLWVTNRGPSTATSIVLTNPFPAGATFVSATTPSGTTNLSSGGIGWNLGAVASNVTVAATLTLKASGSTSTILNSATVTNSAAGDPVAANNSASTAVTVSDNPNMPLLSIVRSGNNVVLSWSTNATGFVLQAKTNLATNIVWVNVTNIPVTIGNQSVVTNPVSAGPIRHYRLFKSN